eukprot:614235-Pelagomonas_calceolata.AAC.1
MPAVMRDSWIRGYKSHWQKTSHEPFQTGFFLTVLALLLGTRAALIFVRSIPGRQAHLDQFKIPPQETFTLLNSNSAPKQTPTLLSKLQQLNMLTL